MCKCCVGNQVKNGFSRNIVENLNGGYDTTVFLDDMVLVSITTDCVGKIVSEVRTPVKFCPMCGQRLKQRPFKQIMAKLRNEML